MDNLKLFACNSIMVEVGKMRLASLLSFAILLSGISFQTCAIEPGDIAEPSIKAANMKMPKPIITSPNMGIPEPIQKQQVIPDSNANQTSDKITDLIPVTAAKSDDLSGKWSIKFDDRPDRSLDLTLWSSGKTKIMGYGTLTKGSTGNSVTASGSLAGEELILAVQSAESEYAGQNSDRYDLSLILANNTSNSNSTMLGTYILSVGGEFMGDGNATASKH